MCWVSSEKDTIPQSYIAKEDIMVYKVLTKSGLSPFFRHFYIFNELTENINVIPNRFGEIMEGYHSYLYEPCFCNNLYAIMGDKNNPTNIYKTTMFDIHKAVIPKGTKYYKNYWGEMVSETIIVTDEIVDINKYIK